MIFIQEALFLWTIRITLQWPIRDNYCLCESALPRGSQSAMNERTWIEIMNWLLLILPPDWRVVAFWRLFSKSKMTSSSPGGNSICEFAAHSVIDQSSLHINQGWHSHVDRGNATLTRSPVASKHVRAIRIPRIAGIRKSNQKLAHGGSPDCEFIEIEYEDLSIRPVEQKVENMLQRLQSNLLRRQRSLGLKREKVKWKQRLRSHSSAEHVYHML